MPYRCNDCGEIFSHPEIVRDDPSDGERGAASLPGGFFEYTICGRCKSDQIAAVKKCASPGCPEWTETDEVYCEKCQSEIARLTTDFQRDMIAKFVDADDENASYELGFLIARQFE